jgi:outer membrane protein TolC
MDIYADDLATLVAQFDLTNAIHIGHSTGGGEVVRFPQSTVSGFGGGVSPQLSAFHHVWSLTAELTGPIFQGGQIRANSQANVAAWEQAKLRYEQAVMTAFHEVASALIALEKRAQAEQARAVTASPDAVQIAHRRYRGGLASYDEVLEAQQLLLPAETQLAQIRATRLSTSVQLSKLDFIQLSQFES